MFWERQSRGNVRSESDAIQEEEEWNVMLLEVVVVRSCFTDNRNIMELVAGMKM